MNSQTSLKTLIKRGIVLGGILASIGCGDRPVESPPADPPDEVSQIQRFNTIRSDRLAQGD